MHQMDRILCMDRLLVDIQARRVGKKSALEELAFTKHAVGELAQCK
jgi:hypothetical protein